MWKSHFFKMQYLSTIYNHISPGYFQSHVSHCQECTPSHCTSVFLSFDHPSHIQTTHSKDPSLQYLRFLWVGQKTRAVHNSHLFHGSMHQISSSCCFHTQDFHDILYLHHSVHHLLHHHSHLLLHHKDSLGCSTSCPHNSFPCTADLQAALVELLEKGLVEVFLQLRMQHHNSHLSRGNRTQTVYNCCCHKQDLLDIQHDHHSHLHQEDHHNLPPLSHMGSQACSIACH